MRSIFCLSLLLTMPLFPSVDEEWINQVKSRIEEQVDEEWLQKILKKEDSSAADWLKGQLQITKNKEVKHNFNGSDDILKEALSRKKKCTNGAISQVEDPKNLIFISFSVPEQTWKNLSLEAEKQGAIFVIKGLPDNSFVALARRLKKFREDGIHTAIQVNPMLFEKYRIDAVPSFVVTHGEKWDKISGNISLSFALKEILDQGDTREASP